MKKHLLLALLFASSHAFSEQTLPTSTPKKSISHNLWYTMSADQRPWGYIHEVIDATKSGLNCKVEIVRQEGNGLYSEHLSAMAENDEAISPRYFNLRKYSKTSGAMEIVDGNYDSKTGLQYVKVSGQRNFKQHPLKLPKNTILECFIPTWLQKHFKELLPGVKRTVYVFAESSTMQSFRAELARISVPLAQKRHCKSVHMEFQGVESEWCIRPDGTYEEILIERAKKLVKLVPDEKTAKDFLSKTKK